VPIDLQTLLVVVAVAAAAVYVARSYWPRKKGPPGCTSCPANPNRRDDYA
jgi:hypothetical protein